MSLSSEKMTVTDIALKALDYLWSKRKYTFKLTSSRILTNVGLPETSRAMMLKVLHRLADASVIERAGNGHFTWSIPEEWKLKEDDAKFWTEATIAALFKDSAGRKVKVEIDPKINQRLDDLEADYRELKVRVVGIENKVPRKTTVEIKKADGKVIELEDTVAPPYFKDLCDLASMRQNILLVGPSGCGKSVAGSLVAKALELPFASLSCSEGITENHILGRSVPNMTTGESTYQSAPFIDMFENGGVFLLDEVDAANPNLLLCVNAAIANGFINVPNRGGEFVKRHKDFVLIAAANTFGRGANRIYAGRNQLDDATLDRFRIGTIECDYSEEIEAKVCPNVELRRALTNVRKKIEQHGLRRVMSTRFMEKAYLMHSECDWSVSKILDIFFNGWSSDEKAKVR